MEIVQGVEKRWRDRVEEAKDEVQKSIGDASAPDDLKDELMEATYLTKRIRIDYAELLDAFETDSPRRRLVP